METLPILNNYGLLGALFSLSLFIIAYLYKELKSERILTREALVNNTKAITILSERINNIK